MKKYKSNILVILFFTGLLMIILSSTFLTPFNPYDETWNFQNIFKMYTGGTIYNSNNVIDTPIFFVLGNLFFHLFGANLYVFRMYNVIIFLIKYVLLFFIFKKLGSNNFLSILYLTLWLTIDFNNIGCSANYNQLALIMCFIGILWYITYDSNKFYHLGQGFIIFLVFFTKQNIGIYYAFGIIFFELLNYGFNKRFFIHQFMKLASFLPCLLISLLIMFFHGNLINFVNLCFGSLLEFGSSNNAFNKNTFPYIFGMIFIIIFSICMIKNRNVSETSKKHMKFLLCLAISLSFMMLPIINPYHTIMSITFYYLLFIYIMDMLILREIFTSKLQNFALLLICFFILCTIFIKIIFSYFYEYKNLKHFDPSHPFYNATISEENLTHLNEMTNYISEKREAGVNVVILSYEAAVYMVPLHINNGSFDMLFSGNLGYHGISNTIDKISKMQNTEFLIFTNEDDCFYQEPKQVRDYIINNLEKKEEFLNYSIYINN